MPAADGRPRSKTKTFIQKWVPLKLVFFKKYGFLHISIFWAVPKRRPGWYFMTTHHPVYPSNFCPMKVSRDFSILFNKLILTTKVPTWLHRNHSFGKPKSQYFRNSLFKWFDFSRDKYEYVVLCKKNTIPIFISGLIGKEKIR